MDSCGLNLKELSITLGMDNRFQNRAMGVWKIGYICADMQKRNWTSIEGHSFTLCSKQSAKYFEHVQVSHCPYMFLTKHQGFSACYFASLAQQMTDDSKTSFELE